MNWIDFSILGVIAVSALISLTRGFVKEALSLLSWCCAFYVASHYFSYLASWLTSFEQPVVRNGVAIALLMIAVLILGALVNYIISTLVQITGLSGTDRLLGMGFGILRGVLCVTILLFFLDTFSELSSNSAWTQSQLIPHFKVIIQWLFGYLQSLSSFLPQTH